MQVDDLILTKKLGKGSFGEVYLTKKNNCTEKYATKRLDRAFSEKPENKKRLANEILILKSLNHPNIVRLIELKKTKTHIYIVTEFCNGGSLSDCLRNYVNTHFKPFPEEIVQYLMRQIVKALYYLHSNKILHRDLKLDNILVNFPTTEDKEKNNLMSVTVKLIDFGFATKLRESRDNLTYTVLGTPTNMEPHLLNHMEMRQRNYEGYDDKADIWSLGTLCHEMLVGYMTFGGRSMEELYQKVREGNYSLPVNSSKEVVSFINGMLQYEPDKRLSAKELLEHDFLVKSIKDFQRIDTKKVEDKISGNNLNINIKSNNTIFQIFNENDKMPNTNQINEQNQNWNNNQGHHHQSQIQSSIQYAQVTRLTPQSNNNSQFPNY